MVKKRIIFTLLYEDGSFVLSRNFRLQKVGKIDWLKNNYNFDKIAFFIDELIILDVSRGHKDIHGFAETVRELSKRVFVPLAAGGGVDSNEKGQILLRAGADKIVVNTLLVDNENIVSELKSIYGAQCIVGSVDAKKSQDQYRVYVKNGTYLIPKSLRNHLQNLSLLGVGEIYLNSIDRDGTGMGYDLGLLEEIPSGFDLPVILAGGVGNEIHLAQGLMDDRVDAAATAHLFNFVGDGLQKARGKVIERGFNLATWPSVEAKA